MGNQNSEIRSPPVGYRVGSWRGELGWSMERHFGVHFWFMVYGVISWRSVLLVDEIGVPGENRRPVASH